MPLRMRVFLPAPVPQVQVKSPVREFRTPGSVRGLSGNWQFYRDVRHASSAFVSFFSLVG